MENSEIENDIEAYAPFRYTISMINVRYWTVRCLISALMEAWGIQKMPQPAVHDHYPDGKGVHGFAELVIPPLFYLSPFFSDPLFLSRSPGIVTSGLWKI
ncbi:hypothetical protein [Methanoregula sp.]